MCARSSYILVSNHGARCYTGAVLQHAYLLDGLADHVDACFLKCLSSTGVIRAQCPCYVYPAPSTCFTLCTVLPPLQPGNSSDDDYAKVLEYSYLFYEAQQSGVLPSWNRLLYGSTGPYGTGYRKNAHTNENVNGVSLAGGWYDAGGE
jgi:hypothetical protein